MDNPSTKPDPFEACPVCNMPRKDWSENYGRGYEQDELLFCSAGCAERYAEEHKSRPENRESDQPESPPAGRSEN